jgi:hypothetical protein
LTDFSANVLKCLSNWAEKSKDCNGDINCLERNTKELRKCLDIAFPPSTKMEFENDKINYILSSIFFLSNRLAKSMIGLSELDKQIDTLVKKEKNKLVNTTNINKENQDFGDFDKLLDDILAKYF